MEEEKDLYPGEVNLPDFLGKVKIGIFKISIYWKWIFGISILSGLIGWYYAESLPENYVAEIVFVFSEGNNVKEPQIPSIVGQFGFNNEPIKEGGVFNNQNFIALLTHVRMIKEVLLKPYPKNTKESFGSYFIKFSKLNIDSFPKNKEYKDLSREQILILRDLSAIIKKGLLVESADDGTTFSKYSGKFIDENFTKLILESLLSHTINFYKLGKTEELRENINKLEHRQDSLYRILLKNSTFLAKGQSQSINLNPAYQSNLISYEFIEQEKLFIGKLYQEVISTLEIQRRTLFNETPYVRIIAPSELPLNKEIVNKFNWIFYPFLLGLLISLIFIISYLYIIKDK